TPQRAYIRQLLAEGYIGRFQLCTMELFLDRYVSREPRPLSWNAYKSEGGAATRKIVKAETDDTFSFMVTFKNGGMATMTSSFAVTPARGAKIAVMGDRGTLI